MIRDKCKEIPGFKLNHIETKVILLPVSVFSCVFKLKDTQAQGVRRWGVEGLSPRNEVTDSWA